MKLLRKRINTIKLATQAGELRKDALQRELSVLVSAHQEASKSLDENLKVKDKLAEEGAMSFLSHGGVDLDRYQIIRAYSAIHHDKILTKQRELEEVDQHCNNCTTELRQSNLEVHLLKSAEKRASYLLNNKLQVKYHLEMDQLWLSHSTREAS